MQKCCCILIWRSPSVLLVFTRRLMGKLNFRGYLISRFYPTREIRENLMHAKKCVTRQVLTAHIIDVKRLNVKVTESVSVMLRSLSRLINYRLNVVAGVSRAFVCSVHTCAFASLLHHKLCQNACRRSFQLYPGAEFFSCKRPANQFFSAEVRLAEFFSG